MCFAAGINILYNLMWSRVTFDLALTNTSGGGCEGATLTFAVKEGVNAQL